MSKTKKEDFEYFKANNNIKRNKKENNNYGINNYIKRR